MEFEVIDYKPPFADCFLVGRYNAVEITLGHSKFKRFDADWY